MQKKSVLFVDDEPQVLSGLRRMLRPLRNEMTFYFVESGQEVLALIDSVAVDVIVSDMRMPGMDGAELLAIIQKTHPEVIRLILTGQADEESLIRSVGVVHQILAKPADPEVLRDVLSRACALRTMMGNIRLKNLITSLGDLPTLPDVYVQLQDKLSDPESSIDDIAMLVEKDLAISTKILQIVNSSFFGLRTKIARPARAVAHLGLDTVKAMVFGASVFKALETTGSANFSLTDLWEHSFITAAFAQKIMQMESEDEMMANYAFIAGVVHDIGKLLLFSKVREEYIKAVDIAVLENLHISDAEYRVFHTDHSEVCCYLIGLWGFPGDVMEAVAFHNRPGQYPGSSFGPVYALYFADCIYYELFPEKCVGGAPEPVSQIFTDGADCIEKYATWRDACKSLM